MSEAIQIRKLYFKGKAPISAYGNGGFKFANISHKGPLLCAPSGFYDFTNIELLYNICAQIEILLIGKAPGNVAFKDLDYDFLKSNNIVIDIINTGAAVRTYNILLSEDRRVAALLYPV